MQVAAAALLAELLRWGNEYCARLLAAVRVLVLNKTQALSIQWKNNLL